MSDIPLDITTAAALTRANDGAVCLNTAEFTRRLVAAEDGAWTEAHARYAPRLYRYLLVAAHGDEQAACEALQSAFVRAVKHARVFQTEEALWSWFTLLARHALTDSRRSAGRWRRFLDRWGSAAPAAVVAPIGDPLADHLDEALAGLEESDRRLLEEKYFDAATVRELAAAAETTEKAIESRLARARARLRDRLVAALRRDTRLPPPNCP